MATIALGSDHAGYDLKREVISHLEQAGVEYKDFGCFEGEKCDYPVIAEQVCEKVVAQEYKYGILICGTGIGISMAANKMKGIRAAVCTDYYSAKYTRLHNDANILCLGGRVIGGGVAAEIVDVFLSTEFEGGRHANRVSLIMDIERNQEGK